MGHIEKRGERRYRISIEWDRDQSGARQRRNETVRGTLRDAERRIRELETARDRGDALTDARLTTGAWLEEWLNAWRAKPLARKTRKRYEELINLYLVPTIGRVPLAKLGPSDIQRAYQYADTRGRSGTTLLHIHRVLSTSLKAAVRAGKVNRNAADMVEAPTASTKRRATLSPEELQEVLSLAADTPYAPLYFLAAATGMREGELLAFDGQTSRAT